MAVALRLAERGLGRAWPNPAVGCVVVQGGRIVGRGWTQPGGRPHAEVEALNRAGDRALGATAYVSLEPCAHYGHTPPCTMALIHAGVRRVAIAAPDPDPRVDGRGIAQLRQAGIEVETDVRRAEAEALNAGFMLKVRAGRPLVTLKLATSLDGRIATAGGASQWITGPAARARGHELRATHDAILIGSGTALADDPALTCRLPGMADRSPVRIVLDGRLRVAPTSRLARTAGEVPTWLLTRTDADPERGTALEALGVELVPVESDTDDRLDPHRVLAALAARGLTRVLIEGGAEVAATLLRAGLVDRLAVFQGPSVSGGDGRAAVDALGLGALIAAPRFRRVDGASRADDDVHWYVRDTA